MSTRPAVPIDEEGASASRSSWRIDGPEATDECRRRIFYDVDEAVAAVRAANGHAQPITVCPLTGRGTDAAARAAGDDARIEVSDYQVWITEQAGTFRPWLIHYFGDGTRKRRTMAADSVGAHCGAYGAAGRRPRCGCQPDRRRAGRRR